MILEKLLVMGLLEIAWGILPAVHHFRDHGILLISALQMMLLPVVEIIAVIKLLVLPAQQTMIIILRQQMREPRILEQIYQLTET